VTARLLRAYLAAEPLAGGLPGHAQGGGDPVPAPPVRPGKRDAFSEQHLIPAGTFGGFGDRAQVGEVFHLNVIANVDLLGRIADAVPDISVGNAMFPGGPTETHTDNIPCLRLLDWRHVLTDPNASVSAAMRPGRAENPPAWALPVTVPGDLVLISQPGALVGIGPICAYPVGFTFYLMASLDSTVANPPELLFLGRTTYERQNMTRFLIRYSDGMTAASGHNRRAAEKGELTLRYCGEQRQPNRNWVRQESMWWVSPLPPPGPVEFQIHLPALQQATGATDCDGTAIIQAASRSEILWPGARHP